MSMLIPKIVVKISDFDYNVKSIAELLDTSFTDKNKSLPFRERVFRAFPILQERITDGMSNSDIYSIVENTLRKEYETNSLEMMERRLELQGKLETFLQPVLSRMLELFEVSWPVQQKEIICYLGLYTVFPRDVLTKEYWIHYRTSEDVILKASIHEINHFILFEKWKSMHGYNKIEQPNHPEALWFLEEMAVDPTLNNPVMQEVAPYYQRAYQKFYENNINGFSIEEYIIKFFHERNNMADFLDRSYEFITNNLLVINDNPG